MRVTRLRGKVILASMVLIVPFVIWNVLLQVSRLHENRAEAIAAQQYMAKHVADACAAWVHSVIDLECGVGCTLWNERSVPTTEASTYLTRLISVTPAVRHIAVADAAGVVFAGDVPPLVGFDTSRHPFVRRVMQGADWAVSDVFPMEVTGEQVVGVAVGIRGPDRKLQGIVLALLDEANLKRIMRHDIVRAGRVVITDSKGSVVLAHGDPELRRDPHLWAGLPFVRRALAGEALVVERFTMPSGRVMLGAVHPVREFGWAAGVFCPREEVIGPVRRQAEVRGLLVSVLIGLMIGMAVYLGNRLARPILNLADTTRRFGAGDLEARADVHTGDEMESLGASFNEMAARLQERTSELNRSVESERGQSKEASALYTVAQGLVVTTTLNERLEVIARALASISGAARAAIFLRRGDRLVAGAGWGLLDPESFRGLTIDIGNSAGLVHEALMPGTPIVVPDASRDPRVDPAMAEKLSSRGFLALPLVRRNQVVGLAILDNPGEYPHFEPEAIETARGLATLAAISIENAEAFEKWASIAQAFQSALLPPVCEDVGAFRFACRHHAAMGPAELGGDFYDVISLPDDRVGIVVADVSGKGLEAAIFTAMGRYTLRAFVSEGSDPGPALGRTNRALARAGGDWGFITMFYGALDPRTGSLTYANAGHPPCIVVRPSGEMLQLRCAEQQPPLGIFADIEYVQDEYRLSPGDILVGYTDGVIDARRDGETFEASRLERAAAESRHLPPKEIAEVIYRAVLDFSRGRLQDDIALMVIKHEQV